MQNNDEVKYWHLRNHQLFWVLSNSQIKQLCIITNYKKAKKGDILEFADPEMGHIFLLKKGNLKIVQVDEDGNELIIDLIHQGELFGELKSSQNGTPYEYAQVMSDRVSLCRFDSNDFEKLLSEHPQLALSYTKLVGFKLKRVKNRYSNLFFLNTKDRLVAFLKDWAMRDGNQTGDTVILNNFLTQKDISQIICASRQTTTQLFNEWEKQGLIEYSRKEIRIKNLEKLK